MTDHPTTTHLPTAAHIDALRTFLHARHDEADQGAQGAQSAAAHRAHTVLFSMATEAIGYVSAALRDKKYFWLPGDDRRWWLLLQIADGYKDHPDFPETVRPFLDALEWQ